MAVTVDELRSVMRMELGPYTRDLQRLHGVNAATAKRLESTWQATNARFNRLGQSMARSIAAPLAGIASAITAKEVLHYADAWTSAKNSLAVAGVTGRRQVEVLDQLYEAAQRNAAPIGALAGLYGKAAQAGDVLNASQAEIIQFSGGVATALRVAGTGAGAASGALTQLGQLLGSARVQAEEFNSINEGARPILMAVAAGLDEAGGSVSKLKQLVNDGKISGRQFFDAFLKGLPAIEKMAANSTQTIEQGWTKVDNALTKYIGSTDETLGASQRLVTGLNAFADNFKEIADITLMVAGVISGALVGRSIAGMLISLGLGSKALFNFAKAIAAARTVASLGIAVGGLGAVAGPVGAAIGTLLTGALIVFGSQSGEASDSARAYAKALAEIEAAADASGEAVEKASKRYVKSEQKRATEAADFGAKKVADARAELEKVIDDVIFPKRAAKNDEVKRYRQIVQQFKDGSISAEELSDKLRDLERANPKFGRLADDVEKYVTALDKAAASAKILKDRQADLDMATGDAGRNWSRLGTAIGDRDKKKDFLDQRNAEAMRSDLEKDIATRTAAILKAAEEVGVKLNEAAARIQAKSEMAAEAVVKANSAATSSAAEAIKGYESFRPTPYWDVNAYRVGYGSDTVTLDDGSVQRVTQGISVSVADANRDLERRIGEFQAGIRQRIGGSTFDGMSSGQQTALTSIAYNYGSLPDRIVDAIKSGNDETVYRAIKGLGEDNAGINKNRRNSEAELYLGGMSSISRDKIERDEGFESRLKEQREMIASLKAETAIRASLNPLVNDYGQAMSTLQAGQYLLNAAMQEGTAAGRELKDVQQLLFGDLAGLSPAAREQAEAMRTLAQETGNAEAAGTRLSASQEQIRRSTEEWTSMGRDVTKGFVQDLLAGKSAAESLANALEKVADKLLDNVLDAIFQVNSAGSQGGGGNFFGSIFSGLFGGGQFGAAKSGKLLPGLFASGGWTGYGGKYEPAGTVHKGEYVFDQESVRAAGGPSALDEVRQRLRGHSGGGAVGNFTIPRVALPRIPPIDKAAREPRIQYVPVPYIADVGVSDDGRLDARMRSVAGDTVRAQAPQIVGQSVTAVGKRARSTKSYLG